MTASDLHSLTGVYAVDALDRGERQVFETHLDDCPICREEVDELSATTSRLASAVSATAPAALRGRVIEQVARTRQLPPVSSPVRLSARRRPRWWQQPASAAAALLLVVSGGLAIYAVDQDRRADEARQQADRVAAVATDPDRVERTVPAEEGGTATVVAADGTAIFRTAGLATLDEGLAYQLWVLRGEEALSAGVLGRGGRLAAVVDDMEPSDSLGLTVEPDGGSAQPTSPVVLTVPVA